MSTLEPTQKYLFTFPQDEEGNDIKYRFILTLSKRLGDNVGTGEETIGSRLMKLLSEIDGIDGVSQNGFYTMQVAIAHTFDAEQVLELIERGLEQDVLSEIIRPPTSIVTPN